MKLPDQKRIEIATTRISLDTEFNDLIALAADCHCGSEFHRQNLHVEIDGDCNEISLTIYGKLLAGHWYSWHPDDTIWETIEKRYKDFKWRLFWAASLIFRGYAEGHSTFSLMGDDQINDYLDVISRARNKIWLKQQQQLAEKTKKELDAVAPDAQHSDGC